MKTLLLILLTAGVAFASAYLVVSNQQSSAKAQFTAAQSQWQSEKAALESALAEAKGRPAQISITPAASTQDARLTPRQILEKLIAIRPGTGAERTRNIRQVVYYLESLAEWKTEALPDIREFLARNEDVDYTATDETSGDNAAPDPAQNNRNNRQQRNNRGDNIWQFRRGGELRTDFVLPPSLRLGLVDVLRAIGGGEAEKILADTLGTTGCGIEVAYIARVLEELAPGKYRILAITAAKDLLTHPPVIDSPNRLDELSKGYLYGVLSMYGDTSFADIAQSLLIGADGRIDRSALDYLSSTMKEMAVPSLYAAYSNPALTNQFDKASVGNVILNYVGNNQTANQLFTQVLADQNLDDRVKAFTVARLSGFGFGPFGGQTPTDPQQITARLGLLTTMQTQYADDPTLSGVISSTIQNLHNVQDGKPTTNPMQGLFGGRGGNRNRFGGNGGN